jgi:hypothetical protein
MCFFQARHPYPIGVKHPVHIALKLQTFMSLSETPLFGIDPKEGVWISKLNKNAMVKFITTIVQKHYMFLKKIIDCIYIKMLRYIMSNPLPLPPPLQHFVRKMQPPALIGLHNLWRAPYSDPKNPPISHDWQIIIKEGECVGMKDGCDSLPVKGGWLPTPRCKMHNMIGPSLKGSWSFT